MTIRLAVFDCDGTLVDSGRGLAHVLARHGLAKRFVTLQTADRHPSKPDPAMLLAAMAEASAEVVARHADELVATLAEVPA